jgi:hypothetical protein
MSSADEGDERFVEFDNVFLRGKSRCLRKGLAFIGNARGDHHNNEQQKTFPNPEGGTGL